MTAPGTRISPAVAPPPPLRSGGRGSRLADLVGVGPPMLLFCLFIIVPMIGAVVLSFVRWNGLGTPQWAGGANWAEFFRDPVARTSVIVTAKVVVLSYVVQTPISMALGMFTAGKERYKSVYATIFVLPLLLSTAGIALMWESLLDPNFGALLALSRSWHLPFRLGAPRRRFDDHHLFLCRRWRRR